MADIRGTEHQVGGDTLHDDVDSGRPVKVGGKVSTSVPTPVANADRTDAWFDDFGRIVTSDTDPEIGSPIGGTGLRDRLFAQRYTVLADSLADGLAGFWTSSTANGGTATSSGGEGLLQTSANATGSAQLVSTTITYFPGQVSWFNSAVRFNDTGSAGNIRRIGVYTVSGTTPQDGFYYELNGTTLNAVVVKGASATATASGSWSRASIAPFTLDTNYHSFEIRFTANTVWFYIDNVLRHVVTGTNTPITATLNFPMTIVSVNTSGASNRLIAVRNIGVGRFGSYAQHVDETGLSAIRATAMGGGTPHDSVDSGNPVKVGAKAIAHGSNPTAVAAADRTDLYANRHGIPFQIGGHPNVITREYKWTTAQTDDDMLGAISSGTKVVITMIQIYMSKANTVDVGVRIGFGTANVPTEPTDGNNVAGVIFAHPKVAAGSGAVVGNGAGIIGIGGDGEELRITADAPTTGSGKAIISYFTIES